MDSYTLFGHIVGIVGTNQCMQAHIFDNGHPPGVSCICKPMMMKHLLTAIACFFALSMSAQFIPQPMGYNPDSNSDSFVGIDDLMAVLSLYGTPYDSGDSVEVVTLDFTGFENDTLQLRIIRCATASGMWQASAKW